MKKISRRFVSLLMSLVIVCSIASVAGAFSYGDIFGGLLEYYCPYGDEWTHAHTLAYKSIDRYTHAVYCANGCGYISRTEDHTTNCGCYPNSSGITRPGDSYAAVISQTSMSLSVDGSGILWVTAVNSGSIDNVVWASSNDRVATVSASNYLDGTAATVTGVSAGQATITATVYKDRAVVDRVSCKVTVGKDSVSISGSTEQLIADGMPATLYVSGNSTALNAAIRSGLASVTWSSSNSKIARVDDDGYLNFESGYVYVYGVAAGRATIYAQVTYGEQTYTAAYEVVVSAAADANVVYSLTAGKSLNLDTDDFAKFWDEVAYTSGGLDHVVFGSSNGNVGQLTYKRTGSSTNSAVGSASFYVKPGNNRYTIDEVTFTPRASANGYYTGTLTVPFTAYGKDRGYSAANASYHGTLYIMVTNGEVADIDYKHTGTGLSLVAEDFVSVYKTAMKSTAAKPTVYIQFQDVPVNGALYYDYSAVYGYYSGTQLTKNNINGMRFSSNSTAAYGIEDVTYVPNAGKGGDVVRYVAYNSATGGTPLYIGEVIFGAGTVPEVRYYAAINENVGLKAIDFYNNADLYAAEYINFGTPSSGVLYKNYANGSGTRVAGSNTFTAASSGSSSVPSINTLTYVPAANFTGVVKIPFTASNLLGGTVSGTVKIYVAKTFADVSKGYSWASDYIIRLTAEKIVNGKTATTYDPGADLTYGEALKLIMEATGAPAAVITDGSAHWAKNYLTKAYSMGLVSSNTINLNSKITRDQVAELAAKALGLNEAKDVIGPVEPSDSTNGYVYALYNAGILNGNTVNGKNYYYGSNTINRAEIAKIICLVSDYYAANK